MRAIACQLHKRIQRPHFERRQTHRLLTRQAYCNNLPAPGPDDRHAPKIGGLQRQRSRHILQQHRRIDGRLLDDLHVFCMIERRDLKFVFAVKVAEPVHLHEHSARGASNRSF